MRIGVFGGTFDPPHTGHLIAAQDAYTALSLDRLLFVPAARPPHKRRSHVTDGGIRLRLVHAALDGDRRFETDDLELHRAGPSYTVDTLHSLSERHPGAELFLLIGTDQFRELDSWHQPSEIRRLATIAVLEREGESAEPACDGDEGHVRRVPVTRIDLSSTDVRQRVALGRPIRYLVPAAVEKLIVDLELYASGAPD